MVRKTTQWTVGFALVAILGSLLVAVVPSGTSQADAAMKFGMDMSSIDAQTSAGAKPDYGTFWVGSWTLQYGWGGPDGDLDRAYATGTTPAIQFYYWGDDISITCIEQGCYSGLHGARKDKTGWQTLTQQLVDHLNARMKGRPVIVILETEFNKGDVARYEPFDGYLTEKVHFIKQGYPAAQVVLAFGNWGSGDWGTFDRAAAASDLMGIQGMRGSTRNSLSSYLGLVDATLDGVKTLRTKFGKPVLITDIALSTYPEPDYLEHQRAVIAAFMGRLGEFEAQGVVGLIYRSYWDNPNFDTKNYFGEAERHWGLNWPRGGDAKPSLKAWIDGVNAARATAPVIEAEPAEPVDESLYEVEAFPTHTTGRQSSDEDASGAAAWNLWANGYAETTVTTSSSGLHEVTLWARGNEAGGVPPHAVLRLGDRTVLEADPRAGDYQPFAAAIQLYQGTHTLRVTFTNDAIVNGQDRNLILDAVTVVPVERVEAEAFAKKTTGARQSDTRASAGARWNLWANGYVEHTVEAPAAGDYVLRVRAAGDVLNGIAPHMVVRVDGAAVGTGDPGIGYRDVVVALPGLAAGDHAIRIDFTNDARTSWGDRNLLLDRVELVRVP